MIALRRARSFSAGNWQIFLTKQQPEYGPLIGVYIALTFFGAEQPGVLLRKPIYTEPDKTATRWFKTP